MKKKAVFAAIFTGVLLIMGIGVIGTLRWKSEWIPEKYIETNKFLANSERGFYNMRGVLISDSSPVTASDLESILLEEQQETLELLQINIGEYYDRELSQSAIEQIRTVLDIYNAKKNKVQLIVRPLYDWNGYGNQSDPTSISLVMRHMEQLGEIFSDYTDQIYIVQGVLVGSWAEMHSSRYLTQGNYLNLINQMNSTMPEGIFLAVRTPAYWRMAAGRKEPLSENEAWLQSNLISRLSLFNDGILGNSLDCGTYGDILKERSESVQDKWTREDELAFQNRLNLYVPNGGEAVLDNELNDIENADSTFKTMHVSYLNRAHDPEVIRKWENTTYKNENSVYSGLTGYDYIERHLGYRFVIRDASISEYGWKWQNSRLSLCIENVGYSSRYTPCRMDIILKNEKSGSKYSIQADTDVRKWKPGETVTVECELDIPEDGMYEVWLRVTGEDEKPVLFANEDITAEDGSCLLGRIKKGE